MGKAIVERPGLTKLDTGQPEGFDADKQRLERQAAANELLKAGEAELLRRLVLYNAAHPSLPYHILGSPIIQYGGDKGTVIRYELQNNQGTILPALCYWHDKTTGGRSVFIDVKLSEISSYDEPATYHLDKTAGRGVGGGIAGIQGLTHSTTETHQDRPASSTAATGAKQTPPASTTTPAVQTSQKSKAPDQPYRPPTNLYTMFNPERTLAAPVAPRNSALRPLTQKLEELLADMFPWWLPAQQLEQVKKKRGLSDSTN